MNNCNSIANILLRGGTDQLRRNSKKLDPASIELHGFGLEEWMKFAYNFAGHVNYFDPNTGLKDNFWTEFFLDEDATEDLLKDLEESDELTPHLTLFICFLRLLEFSSSRMNAITKRHLDFYYKDVLHLEKLPPTYDKVHVIFELSKNIIQAKLESGTKLNAGKDNDGIQRFYELIEETSVNSAKLTDFKSFYFDPDYKNPTTGITTQQYYMKAAPVANSLDGLGEEPLNADQPTWYGFGYNHNRVEDSFLELPNANIGFAITSKVLELSEGIRHLQFEIKFAQTITSFTPAQLDSLLEVSYTTEKGWSDSVPLIPSFNFSIGGVSGTYNTSVNPSQKTVRLLVKIDKGAPASVPYSEAIHGINIDADKPVFRFQLNTNSELGLSLYKEFIKSINWIETKVHVSGMRNLKLDNDQGGLNPKKPISPFTNIPVKGSSFSVYNEEVFSKKWDYSEVQIGWKNAPESFSNWYQAYLKTFQINFSPISYSNSYDEVTNLFKTTTSGGSGTNKIVTGASYFTAKRVININGTWNAVSGSGVTLFQGSSPYSTKYSFTGSNYQPNEIEGIRISLNQTFLHEMYPKLYATALTNPSRIAPLPNEPYAPLTEDISLSYTATDRIVLNVSTLEHFEARENAFYQEDAFGFALRHPYLRSQLEFLTGNSISLVPKHCRGGELYIGIEGADNLQNISMLVQVLEGSENKQTATFLGNQGVKWEILCSNYWKPLDSSLLLKNGTGNFLQTGIVKFKIPKEATDDNTLLDSGKFWIKATMLKSFDAVCEIINIHSQVAKAQFVDNGNELSHLETGLAAETISKLFQRSANIKTVKQPYNSFGGSPEETDEQFYRRVSERLRHKNRAITLWDYEHLILQEFQDLFRVKCLNHTSPSSFTAPGNVTLIVVPDTVNRNVFNPFQPRVSTGYLNRVKAYVSELNTHHANVYVENPSYEELKVTLKVKFNEGLDETIYIDQLNDDIIRFLSPWAFDETKQVDFGKTLHISVLINYLEKLNYIDYLQDVSMSVSEGLALTEYTPSTPKAIMVSVKKHIISTDIITCEPLTEIITEECQQ